jgi:hypothetical protein
VKRWREGDSVLDVVAVKVVFGKNQGIHVVTVDFGGLAEMYFRLPYGVF